MSTAAPPSRSPVYPDDLRARVDTYLRGLSFASQPDVAGLVEAMRYSLLAGGKRIRPVLALATARAAGTDPETVMPLAASLELIHTYSLIHDDLPAMDDDDLRRGRPTCHIAYGEDVAILAGDGLYAEAFDHLLTHQAGDPAHKLAAAADLARATGVSGMVGGQFIDVKETAGSDAEGLLRLHALKTGALIAASISCVLRLLGVDPATIRAFGTYANELGVLFQIVDDILDVTGSSQDLGKAQGSDERLGKRTYVTEYGLAGAQRLASECHARAARALDQASARLEGDVSTLRQITDFIALRSF
ncbi:MAG TPA: farnesyl diphosphate synthase [Solirubrobacteraceae bacterium]|nr:farnesyl diphosphate synthase [Solirubrobacteraceae bacterium]